LLQGAGGRWDVNLPAAARQLRLEVIFQRGLPAELVAQLESAGHPGSRWQRVFSLLAERLPTIDSIQVRRPVEALNDDLIASLSCFSGLRRLELSGAGIDGHAAHHLAQAGLQSLALLDSGLDDRTLAVLAESGLVSLKLADASPLSDHAIAAFATHQLRELELQGCVAVSALGIARCDKLRSLRTDIALTVRDLQAFAALDLRSLELLATRLSSLDLERALPIWNGLDTLRIKDGWQLDDRGLAALARLPALRSLELARLGCSGTALTALADGLRLEQLTLCGAWVDDSAIRTLANHPGHLTSLTIGAAPALTAAGLAALQRVHQLRCLRLSDCMQLGDDALAVIASCSGLEVLELSRLSLSPVGMRMLTAMPRLRALYLDGGGELGGASLSDLRSASLRQLELRACWVSPDELERIAVSPLRLLALRGCRRFDSRRLNQLRLRVDSPAIYCDQDLRATTVVFPTLMQWIGGVV
jgi:hypothetical protein